MAPPNTQKSAPVAAKPAAAQPAASPAAAEKSAAAPAVLSSVLATVASKEEEANAKKQEALNAAVSRFKDISTSLGGHQQAKAFFDTYGTDGFKPEAPPEEPERIKAKEMTLDSDIKDYSDKKLGLPSRPEGFGAAYAEAPSWDIEEPSEVGIATELDDDAWQHLLSTTKMLHGYVLNSSTGLSRARFQAFQLKTPPGQAYTDSTMIRPEFEVFDASSITIKETKSQVERSMAQNGFSSQAISASVGVSTPYVGVSVDSSYKTETSTSKSQGDFKDRIEYTATYNFPRARIFLDELNLEVTSECARYLVKIQNAANEIKKNIEAKRPADSEHAVRDANRLINQFYARFGHVFASNVQLGGQLTSSKSADSFATQTDEERRDAMQAAVAASVETKAVSVSSSYSKGTETSEKRKNMNMDSSSALAWSARGGNSLLCANPAAWANSVSDYRQWRVMEQGDVVALPDLINKLEIAGSDGDLAWLNIADTFRTIAQNKFNEIPAIQEGEWTGKLKFETLDGKKVVLKDNKLVITDSGESTVFHALDADKSQRHVADPQMPLLQADHPLFLLPPGEYCRESQEKGGQFVGLNVDDNDRIGIGSGSGIGSGVCRWTLRLGEALTGRNNPTGTAQWVTNGARIQHDAEVGLYCHSHHSGGTYTDITKPTPLYAPFAVKKDGDQQLRVFKLDPKWLADIAPDSMKNDPRWAFLNANRTPLQALLEKSDIFQTSPEEDAQLEAYRTAFAMGDPAKWGPAHELLIGPPELCDVYKRVLAGQWSQVKQQYTVALAVQVLQATQTWQVQNNIMDLDPLRLRVKFVN